MENIVILSLEEYNRLMDFEKEIKSGKAFTLESGFYSSSSQFYTQEQIIEKIVDEGNELRRRFDELLRNKQSISHIKKMSIWQFLKWKIGLLELKS